MQQAAYFALKAPVLPDTPALHRLHPEHSHNVVLDGDFTHRVQNLLNSLPRGTSHDDGSLQHLTQCPGMALRSGELVAQAQLAAVNVLSPL